MSSSQPWNFGSPEDRWNGYLISPDSQVLRNRLGIQNLEELQAAENDLLELQVAKLRAQPSLISRTYDLQHLRKIHHHLFQDIYDWAGELRTVGLARDGGDSFAPPLNIYQPVDHVAQRISDTNRLANIPSEALPQELAYLYDYVNFAHPFREGNGRTQREFFQQLLQETERSLNWSIISSTQLHAACHVARNDGDLKPLVLIFEKVLITS
ncbi:MAG: Fic family protein [Aurantimicrobium sp.]